MVKVIVVILIVMVLATACGGVDEVIQEAQKVSMDADPLTGLVYLGKVNYTDVFRFNDGDTVCYLAESARYSTSIYCQ